MASRRNLIAEVIEGVALWKYVSAGVMIEAATMRSDDSRNPLLYPPGPADPVGYQGGEPRNGRAIHPDLLKWSCHPIPCPQQAGRWFSSQV